MKDFLDINDKWIKRKIILSKILKDLNSEIDTKYLRFYRSEENKNNIFIFLLRTGYINENNCIEEIVKEVIEPLSDTIIYIFREKNI